MIVACEENEISACDELEKFRTDENRGWDWVYLTSNTLGENVYYNNTTLKPDSNGVMGIWLRFEENNKKVNNINIDLKCSNGMMRVKQDDTNVWMRINPDSIYADLNNVVCQSKVHQ